MHRRADRSEAVDAVHVLADPDRAVVFAATVTHRVVGESPAGFITRGDANDDTDQTAGYSHVERDDIVGEVLTVGGRPLTIPGYGAAVSAVRDPGLALLLVAALAALLLAASTRRTSGTVRRVPRVNGLLRPVFAACALSAVALILLGATTHELAFVAVASASDAPGTIAVGESRTTTVTVNRSASPVTTAVVTTDNLRVVEEARNASRITLTGRVLPPQSTGRHVARVTVHGYPAVLPRGVFGRLHRLHPVVAAGVTTSLVLTPVYLLTLLAFDGRTPVRPSRSRWARRLGEVFR